MNDKDTNRTDPDAYMDDEIAFHAGMMADTGDLVRNTLAMARENMLSCRRCVREGASRTADEVCAGCARNPSRTDRYERARK